MRTKPFTAPRVETAYEEKETAPEQPAPAQEATAPGTPEPPKVEKTFFQKYGIILLIIAAAATIYFFMKYKIVPKVAAIVS
jgi:hypothetical protein